MAATTSSEKTAAADGQADIRCDPMAMLPFCGYNMGDYFSHWLQIGRTVPKPPLIFRVNWFLKDEGGHFLWPGFGENLRVLKWIVDRAHGRTGAVEGPLGLMPRYEDLLWKGLRFSKESFNRLCAVDCREALRDAEAQKAFLDRFAARLPEELLHEQRLLSLRLGRSGERWVPPFS